MSFLDEPNEPKETSSNIQTSAINIQNTETSQPFDELEPSEVSLLNNNNDTPSLMDESHNIESVHLTSTKSRKRHKSKDNDLLETLVMQLTDAEKDFDEYAAFGKAIGDGIRRLNSQALRDYAMAHLRSELYKLQTQNENSCTQSLTEYLNS